MGDFQIKKINSTSERNEFYNQIITDLEVFGFMLENNMIDKSDDTIGAEQELTIIDQYGNPKPIALAFLDKINDPHYTNELALFDLEINLDPIKLKDKCFSDLESNLLTLLEKGNILAAESNSHLYLTGILPTIIKENLDFRFMTPVERYKVLSNELLQLRGKKFEIYLQGVDDLNLKLDSILFEACNTSFQTHLQMNPDNFNAQYNWSQLISGAVLSCCTNSPILFGKELWAENRIALFKQSLDTRNFNSHYREKLPRVYFGKNWLEGSAIELWKNDVARFPLVFRGEGEESSKLQLESGQTPLLKAVRLHNGTTYTWNRLCYGVDANLAHIRLECRYLPAGPSVVDEIANMMFWVGLMKAMPKDNNFWKDQDFRISKENFYKAARTGLHSEINWFGEELPAQKLILDKLIPMANEALSNIGIDRDTINKYLGVISKRVEKSNTGSDWMIRNFRNLSSKFKPSLCSKILVTESLAFQKKNIPVSEWEDITTNTLQFYFGKYFDSLTVADVMSTEVFSLNDELTIGVAEKIMEWRNFNHIIIENAKSDFKGVITSHQLKTLNLDKSTMIKDIELSDQFIVAPSMPLVNAQKLFEAEGIDALVVMEKNCVVGIVTGKDI